MPSQKKKSQAIPTVYFYHNLSILGDVQWIHISNDDTSAVIDNRIVINELPLLRGHESLS